MQGCKCLEDFSQSYAWVSECSGQNDVAGYFAGSILIPVSRSKAAFPARSSRLLLVSNPDSRLGHS